MNVYPQMDDISSDSEDIFNDKVTDKLDEITKNDAENESNEQKEKPGTVGSTRVIRRTGVTRGTRRTEKKTPE